MVVKVKELFAFPEILYRTKKREQWAIRPSSRYEAHHRIGPNNGMAARCFETPWNFLNLFIRDESLETKE
jgi:hypothetical protein